MPRRLTGVTAASSLLLGYSTMLLAWPFPCASLLQGELCLVSKRDPCLHSTYDNYVPSSFPVNECFGEGPCLPAPLSKAESPSLKSRSLSTSRFPYVYSSWRDFEIRKTCIWILDPLFNLKYTANSLSPTYEIKAETPTAGYLWVFHGSQKKKPLAQDRHSINVSSVSLPPPYMALLNPQTNLWGPDTVKL